MAQLLPSFSFAAADRIFKASSSNLIRTHILPNLVYRLELFGNNLLGVGKNQMVFLLQILPTKNDYTTLKQVGKLQCSLLLYFDQLERL